MYFTILFIKLTEFEIKLFTLNKRCVILLKKKNKFYYPKITIIRISNWMLGLPLIAS